MTRIFRLLTAALVFAATCIGPSAAQQPAAAQAQTYVINLRDTEIRVLAEQVSKITGRTLIVDPTVKGPVTVISAEALSPDGVWQLFQSVLRVNGFAALQSGNAWRIVPQASVPQGGAKLDSGDAGQSQDLVTRLIKLENLPSEEAVRVLKPLVASFGYLEGLKSPNAIVVTDYAENVRRVEELARKLDSSEGTSFTTIPLTYALAKDVGQAIERVLADQPGSASGRAKISVDDRSNSLLVRAEPSALIAIKQLALSLDTPGGASATTRVFRLSYGDAETIADVLHGLVGAGGAANNPVARSLEPGGSARLPTTAAPAAAGVDITSPDRKSVV